MSRSKLRGLVCEEGSALLDLWPPRAGPCGAGLPGRGPKRARPADQAEGLGERAPPLGCMAVAWALGAVEPRPAQQGPAVRGASGVGCGPADAPHPAGL